MMKNRLILWTGMAAVLSLVLLSGTYGSASDSKSGDHKSFAADIVKFTITPVKLRMYPGGSMQLIATAYDSSGKKITVTPTWLIQSEIPSLGEFDKPEGDRVVFSALNSGSGSIIAVFNDLEAEVKVEVYKKGE